MSNENEGSSAYENAVKAMPRELYQRMVDALSTGRWPDGRTLTETQRKETMEAVYFGGSFTCRQRSALDSSIRVQKRVIPVTTLFHLSGNKRD